MPCRALACERLSVIAHVVNQEMAGQVLWLYMLAAAESANSMNLTSASDGNKKPDMKRSPKFWFDNLRGIAIGLGLMTA